MITAMLEMYILNGFTPFISRKRYFPNASIEVLALETNEKGRQIVPVEVVN